MRAHFLAETGAMSALRRFDRDRRIGRAAGRPVGFRRPL
ncbi:hypothetical protein Rrhod_3139 [Rhodococcus rhodnii LMG 5362]|uniref:Uncharacterized protein n=1 Tax=Rhodococcus rhodnii LMG 5362 TaxID=1273125 RepID=R7WJ88_9NOCA|nr:hypothetical protein Rrhod_3139 [Rhodococcus rhodnii LMG 5362]